jgi:threonine/homoserine/homoserine lactone efflux protein
MYDGVVYWLRDLYLCFHKGHVIFLSIQKENAQKSDEMGINSSDENFINFIKPTISKIILFLLLSPILFISSCSLGFFDCNPGHSSENLMIIPFIIVFIEIVILYLISCLIVSGWNRIFSRFHKKNYEKITFLAAAIIFILVILRILSKYLGFL